jgi:hypothetical protein
MRQPPRLLKLLLAPIDIDIDISIANALPAYTYGL